MIPGITASVRAAVASSTATPYPVIKALDTQTASAATSHAVSIPSGWAAGDLCVIVTAVGVTNSSGTVPSGWTREGRITAAGLVTTDVLYRVLQMGDANPSIATSSSSTRASCVYLVRAGTFSDATPMLAASAAGSGTGTTSTVSGGNVSITPTHNLALYVDGHANTSSDSSVSAFPGALGNQQSSNTQGSNRFCCAGSFDEFGAGLTPSVGFTIAPSSTWRTRAFVVQGTT